MRRSWVLLPATLLFLLSLSYLLSPAKLQGEPPGENEVAMARLVEFWTRTPFLGPLRREAQQLLSENSLLARYYSERYPGPREYPAQSAEDSHTLIFPQFAHGTAAGVSITSSVIVINNGGVSSSGTISLFSNQGDPMTVQTSLGTGHEFPFTLHSGEILRLLTEGSSDLQVGWARVISDQPLSGSGTFATFDGVGRFLSEVGISHSPPAQKTMIFVDTTDGKNTGFAFCNPTDSPGVQILYELRDLNGNLVAGKTGNSLGPYEQRSQFVTQSPFSPQEASNFKGVLVVTSSEPVSLVTLRTRGVNFTSLPNAPEASTSGDADDLLFARLGDGLFGDLKFQTSFVLLNNSNSSVSADLILYRADGEPLELNIDGERAGRFAVEVPAGGAKELITRGSTNPGVVGWARVETDSPLVGGATFTILGPPAETFVAEVGVPNSSLTPRPEIYVQEKGPISTGLALTNPSERPVTLGLTLYGELAGNQPPSQPLPVWESIIELPPFSHVGSFIFELFSQVPAVKNRNFEGRLEIEAFDGDMGPDMLAPVTGITLLANGAKLTSVPMADFNFTFAPRTRVEPATLEPGASPAICFINRQQADELPMENGIIHLQGATMDASGVGDADRVGYAANRILSILLMGYGFAEGPGTAERLRVYHPVTFDGQLEREIFYGKLTEESGGVRLELQANALTNEPLLVPFSSYVCLPPGLVTLPDDPGARLLVTESYASFDRTLGGSDFLTSRRTSSLALDTAHPVRIDSIMPMRVTGGDEIVISGQGFSASPGDNRVLLSGDPAPQTQVLAASSTELRVQLPQSLSSNRLLVERGGQESNSYRIEVAFAPQIRVEPDSWSPGASVPVEVAINQFNRQLSFSRIQIDAGASSWIADGFSVGEKVGTFESPEEALDLIVAEVGAGQVTIHAVEPDDDDEEAIVYLTPGQLAFDLSSSGLIPVELPGDQTWWLDFDAAVLAVSGSAGESLTFEIEAISFPERIEIAKTVRTLNSTHRAERN